MVVSVETVCCSELKNYTETDFKADVIYCSVVKLDYIINYTN